MHLKDLTQKLQGLQVSRFSYLSTYTYSNVLYYLTVTYIKQGEDISH